MGGVFLANPKECGKHFRGESTEILLDLQEGHLSQTHKVKDNFLELVISKTRHPEDIPKYELRFSEREVMEGSNSSLKSQRLKNE